MKLLIAEDDVEVASLVTQALMEEGYEAEAVSDGHQAFALAHSGRYALLLIDLMLPGMDGFTLCRELRANRVSTPILIITALDDVKDKVRGLDSGADDYLVKPFLLDELLARGRALMRRSVLPAIELKAANMALNTRTRRVTRAGNSITLSTTECLLLELLMRNQGRVLTRTEIFQHVWDDAFTGNEKILDVYVNHIRSKIDADRSESLIQTVRGVGYRMVRREKE